MYSEKIEQNGDTLTSTPTVCLGCYNCCGVKVQTVNDKVVDVVGDKEAINSRGYICAKGRARFLDLYDPTRVLYPMKRGNPEKGIGVDPEWERITWDEAFATIIPKLKAVREDDPRGLVIAHFDLPGYGISKTFGAAFETTNFHWNRADYCGAAPHWAHLMTNASFNGELDFEECRFMVLWGTQLGHLAETIPLHTAAEMAEARRNGTKLIVIDPFCTNPAAKADQWIPIKPGTDGAMALAMLNYMINDLGIYDREFLARRTNSIYLVQPDGHYLRDAETNKPMVWDQATGTAKPFNTEDISDPALEGSFEIEGVTYQTAFNALKEHLKQFDLESASKFTTVPVDIMKVLTKEFAEAACIGSTVEVDGQQLPYRPAAIHFKRGSGAHKGGALGSFSIHLLNIMVGNLDVPGGQRGVNPIGPFWEPDVDEDGMIVVAQHIAKYSKPYPAQKARKPEGFDLHELLPASIFTRGLYPMGIDNPEKFGLTYKPEVLLIGRTNPMMNSHNAEAMAETLKKFDMQISFATFIDETAEFADILLPDAHDFERWDLFPANDPYAFIAPGPGQWYWHMRQPSLEAPGETRAWTEVYIDIAERLGILEKFNELGEEGWGINEKHRLDRSKRHTVKDIAERQAKTLIGDDFTFADVKDTSCLITREKTIAEAYPGSFVEGRMPIYLEHLIDAGEDLKPVIDELGLEWDFRPYNPLVQHIRCEEHDHEEGDEYDLLIVNFKVPFQTQTISQQNIWLDEVSRANPYTFNVMMHPSAAKRKGLKDGDRVLVKSHHGQDEGNLKVTEVVHPECLGIPATLGHWARNLHVAAKKGTSFNTLLPPPDVSRIDTLSGQVDTCVRVKVSKLG
ncbi:MAG: molybdopterin-dependent oxidoreductase [Rhodospirillaceae bacterium]|jgi:anaerobic selenocysteine-containing dehydrogenase|nr:molybdopterin-dependent oxidoreductase [Rhodospirillaceae bacterium]MBT4587836.1 molybdopterin-dependent oxidoreductase [Rhodospirillaceae bacterium]MBT4938716.1 molybdopterin-dependent oxidoreductase [Rhodospirillaceae bacterium]